MLLGCEAVESVEGLDTLSKGDRHGFEPTAAGELSPASRGCGRRGIVDAAVAFAPSPDAVAIVAGAEGADAWLSTNGLLSVNLSESRGRNAL